MLLGEGVKTNVEAYDWTCEDACYSADDRLKIERDLLRESTALLTAEARIDNKTIGNRSAVAMVGACIGDPALVRFGLDGFHKATREWFLPSGASPESPSYGMMALGGLEDIVVATQDGPERLNQAPRDLAVVE